MIFTLYKAQESLEIEGYKVRGTTPNKVIITPRCKGHQKEKTLEGIGKAILNSKQQINLHSCCLKKTKKNKECELGDRQTYLHRLREQKM